MTRIEKLMQENKDVICARELVEEEKECLRKERDDLIAERDSLEKKNINVV